VTSLTDNCVSQAELEGLLPPGSASVLVPKAWVFNCTPTPAWPPRLLQMYFS